jgi:hypothetical protein
MAEQGTCATCIWWTRQGAAIAAASSDPSASYATGTCCVRPPTIVREILGATAYFPMTHESRFCAEWKPKGDGPEDPAREDLPEAEIVPFQRKAA